jgi:predicted PolB exonuclease-like 3'-5' exonuclease
MKYKKNMKYKKYILDIESKPQEDLVEMFIENIKIPKTYKDKEKIKAYIEEKKSELRKQMSVDPDYADIICIGLKEIGGESKLYNIEDLVPILKEKPILITFNGKGFDIPLLIKAGIKRGLDFPYQDLRLMLKRYSTDLHTDLMELICDKDYKSLDTLLQIYLGIKKTPIDFGAATEEEIKTHCLEDLENTEKLYNKFKKLI